MQFSTIAFEGDLSPEFKETRPQSLRRYDAKIYGNASLKLQLSFLSIGDTVSWLEMFSLISSLASIKK